MADWPKRVAASLLLAKTAVASPALYADDGTGSENLPSIEMLEFLGGWEGGDGEAVDLWYWKEFFEEDVAVPGFIDTDATDKQASDTDAHGSAPKQQQSSDGESNDSGSTDNSLKKSIP